MLKGVFLSATEFQELTSRLSVLEKRMEQAEKAGIEWLTVGQASVIINRCIKTVYALCDSGELVKKQGKRKIEVSAESCNEYNTKYTVKN